MNCELCELQEICSLRTQNPYTLITCEAFKDAVRKYGGKDKIMEDLYNQLKEIIESEEKQDVNKPITYDRLLQSYSFGAVPKRINENGFLLHTPYVSPGRCGQGDTFRITSVH